MTTVRLAAGRALPTRPPLPDHFSFSAMSAFHDCPRKWAYRYLHRVRAEFVPSSLVFGGAVHAALERIHQSWLSGEPVTAAGAMEAFDAHWQAEAAIDEIRFAAGEEDGEMRRQAAALLTLYLSDHAVRGRILAVEEPVVLHVLRPIGLPVPVEGRVDLVVETADSVTVVDAKTGRSAPAAEWAARAASQLALYADALFPAVREIGKPLCGRLVVLRRLKKARIDVADAPLTNADANRVRRAFAETWSLIEAAHAAGAAFPARPSWQCRMCPFQSRCTADTGRACDGCPAPPMGLFAAGFR